MENKGIVQIHGKSYMTVARRVELAHEEAALEEILTEVIPTNDDHVVIRATVTVKGKRYSGISSVSGTSASRIEKSNPYEVAETSAVGRALGLAGYGIIEGIPSADEMHKAGAIDPDVPDRQIDEDPTWVKQPPPPTPQPTPQPTKTIVREDTEPLTCEVCGKPAIERQGVSKAGKNYHGIFCTSENRAHTRWLWS